MSGTREGGLKAMETNFRIYGSDFYREIGRKGGRNGHTGGFAAKGHDFAVVCGRKGGKISRRTGIKNGEGSYRRVNSVVLG